MRRITWQHVLEERFRESAELQPNHHVEGEGKWQSKNRKNPSGRRTLRQLSDIDKTPRIDRVGPS